MKAIVGESVILGADLFPAVMTKRKITLIVALLLFIGYLMGPRPAASGYRKDLPAVPEPARQLEAYIQQKESAWPVKPDNEARIVWDNDSLKNQTDYAIVYLHGFSASQGEGDPLHRSVARKFGCNLFLARLAEHGLDTPDALRKLTADKYWESAKEALSIGKRIGKRIILMGTSTGGTNALQLAAAFPNDVQAVILLSPNIAINNPNAWLLNNPWGLQLATMITGSRYIHTRDQRDIYKRYWYAHYRLEGVVALQEMMESSMNRETFEKVEQPVLLLYYYKDEAHQDDIVKIPVMKEMFAQLKTPDSLKRSMALANVGDHVLGSPIKSKDVPAVELAVTQFMQEVLHLPLKP